MIRVRLIIMLLFSVLLVLPAAAQQSSVSFANGAMSIVASYTTRTMTLRSPDDKIAKIDFSGSEVAYSGDLPVSDAAKIFFNHVMRYQTQVCQGAVK